MHFAFPSPPLIRLAMLSLTKLSLWLLQVSQSQWNKLFSIPEALVCPGNPVSIHQRVKNIIQNLNILTAFYLHTVKSRLYNPWAYTTS